MDGFLIFLLIIVLLIWAAPYIGRWCLYYFIRRITGVSPDKTDDHRTTSGRKPESKPAGHGRNGSPTDDGRQMFSDDEGTYVDFEEVTK